MELEPPLLGWAVRMWLTVTWSMIASACITLGLVHLAIWLRDRENRADALFAVAAFAVAGVGVGEWLMMRAQTPEDYGLAMRWVHVPLFVAIASVVAFVHVYFGTGRRWLGWSVIAIRAVILIVNFA